MKNLDSIFEKIKNLKNQEDYQGILDLLTDKFLKQQNNLDLYSERALALFLLKEYELSKSEADKVLSIDKENARANNVIGNYYWSKNRFKESIKYYEKAKRIDPQLSTPYHNLGIAYYNLEDYEKSENYILEAIKLSPDVSIYYINLGIIYDAKNMYKEAIKSIKKAINICSKVPRYYNNLGVAYENISDYKNALESYSKAISLDPALNTAYYNRGGIHFKNENYKEALSDFERSYDLTKDNRDYYTSFSEAKIAQLKKLLENKKYEEINSLVEKIKKLLLYDEDCITHYTSLSAAKFLIIDGSLFRLSEGSFLNDTSEGRELFKYLDFNSFIPKRYDHLAKPFTQKPFIGSFVAEIKHDDLTLWRMYGKEEKEEAKGCAITIRLKDLISSIEEKITPVIKSDEINLSKIKEEFCFYRVAYRQDGTKIVFNIPGATSKEEKKLNSYMNSLSEELKKYKSIDESNYNELGDIINLLNDIAYLFKSSEYQHENELRLVVKGIGFEKKIDLNFNIPKVYIELVEIRSIIEKITLGPKVERADEWGGLHSITA